MISIKARGAAPSPTETGYPTPFNATTHKPEEQGRVLGPGGHTKKCAVHVTTPEPAKMPPDDMFSSPSGATFTV